MREAIIHICVFITINIMIGFLLVINSELTDFICRGVVGYCVTNKIVGWLFKKECAK